MSTPPRYKLSRNVPTVANDRHRCNYLHCTQSDVIVIINKVDEVNARKEISSTQHAVSCSTLNVTVLN